MTTWGPDPIGVALTFGAPDPAELGSWLQARQDMFAIARSSIEAERQRLLTRGYLDPLSAAVMYRAELHAEAEVRWHDEIAKILADLPAQ